MNDSIPNRCIWSADDIDDVWDTSCGNLFILNEGGPTENGMKFCCYCGKILEQIINKEEEDSA